MGGRLAHACGACCSAGATCPLLATLHPAPATRRLAVKTEPAASLARWEARCNQRRPPSSGVLGRAVGACRTAEAAVERGVRALCGRSYLASSSAAPAAPAAPDLLFCGEVERWLAVWQVAGVAWMLCSMGGRAAPGAAPA